MSAVMSEYEMVQKNTHDEESGLSMTKSTSKDNLAQTPADISWSSIDFSLGEKEKPKLKILQQCWGDVKAGEVCAIMGPSGAGKSSLLNVLAGRSAPAAGINVNGSVKVGGQVINPVAFRKNIAYVMQDDSLMSTATPRECLRFSARLRLHPDTTDEDIEVKVTKMLKQLGLLECADTMVGGEMIKGISGGQRKRTSVGVEIITNPTLLFLDEPTSGLDSFSASSVVDLLKEVAKQNTAVLCTIHQPSSEVFHKFDKVIFMKEGRIFYQGSVPDMAPYFTKIDLACPFGYNPADHAMYLSQSLSHDECVKQGIYVNAPDDKSPAAAAAEGFTEVAFEPPVTSGSLLQLKCLVSREIKSIRRDKGALFGRFGITVFLNLLFGMIFWKAGEGDNADNVAYQGHFGALTMIIISSMMGSAQPVMLTFPFERPMFMREYSTGTYHLWTYFLTKTLLDAPLTLIQTILQFAVVYPMIGFQGNFVSLVAAAWGLGVASASCGMALGCGISEVKKVSEFSPVLFVPQLLFAGFFIATERVPLVLRWCQWLCAIKYAMNLVLITEFDADNASCKSSFMAAFNCARALESNSVVADDQTYYILGLVAVFVGFRTIAAMILYIKSRRFY